MNKNGNITATSDYQIIEAAIAYLSKTSPDQVDLDGFARALGLTRRQLLDLFLRWCGLSVKSFAQAVALDHAKKLLRQQASVLETSFELGLSSPSRLYDLFVTHCAMPPGIWAKRGAGLKMIWGIASSPFGQAVIFTSDYGVAGIGFVDETKDEQIAFADLAKRWPGAIFERNDQLVAPISRRIFDPGLWDPGQPVRLIMIGSDFEIKVWQTLLKIPFGAAASYGQLAKEIGKPKAARAVGAAIGRNPISFVVPCHRVVGASGKLTGYHWGIVRKRAILGWEAGQVEKG
ncbi:ADA regulatory protein / Methylated-DNA--protein-cysteine methyltransferase [hydrothermal vent metagenome]|uniref:methylated-DNA--[protein]-cysteine S-methyltransferase n=1 Tax=hydrothermal vent metagenome TaxID=652676 RepID=A0A3B0TUS7_9ZZZZ